MPIRSFEPDGNYLRTPEPMRQIPEYLWQAQEDVLAYIKRYAHKTPSPIEHQIEFRKHRGEHFVVKIPVDTLGEPKGSISNAPSDRYPLVRALLRSQAVARNGLKLSHESETFPYVVIDFLVCIPKPPPWWVSCMGIWFR